MEKHLIRITSRERKPVQKGYILGESSDSAEL